MTLDLSKEMARLAKIEEAKDRIKNGGPRRMNTGGVKTLITEAERIARKQKKARQNYVEFVMEEKNRVLSEEIEDFKRIQEILPITDKGIQEAEEVLATYDTELARLKAQIMALEFKRQAAENDIDLLTDAKAAWEEFNEAVKAYALSCIENQEEFDEDEIIDLWETMMDDKYVAALNRGTTSFKSIDYLLGTTQGEFTRDPEGAIKAFAMKVQRLFDKYDISEPNEPDMEGI